VTTFDFAKLTKPQLDVLGKISIGFDEGHNQKTLAVLEKLGMIVGEDQEILGLGSSPLDRIPLVVRRFQMPIHVHIAWCSWCEATITDEELAAADEEMRTK